MCPSIPNTNTSYIIPPGSNLRCRKLNRERFWGAFITLSARLLGTDGAVRIVLAAPFSFYVKSSDIPGFLLGFNHEKDLGYWVLVSPSRVVRDFESPDTNLNEVLRKPSGVYNLFLQVYIILSRQ